MDTEVQTTSEVSTGSESSSGAEQSSSSSGAEQASEAQTNQSAAPEAAPYAPNLKYKVMDKEKEFDEALKGIIKDKKTEDLIRDLYTKADGIEEIKEKYKKSSEGYNQISQEFAAQNQAINKLSSMVRNKDFGSYFDNLQIPREDIFRWVLQELKNQELPPEQRMAMEQQREAQRLAAMYQDQSQTLMRDLSQQQTQFRDFQLRTVIERPEVREIASTFDARMKELGKQTNFYQECVKRGIAAYHATGQDITPDQAVREVLELLGHVPQQGASQGQAIQATTQPTVVPPPVIPHVPGRNQSPVKKQVKSLSDLKKLAADMG